MLFAGLYKARVLVVCPICAGVVITWAVGLIGIYSDFEWTDPMFIGLLMAGSIGALAEKYGMKKGLVWKSTLVLVGFPAVYYLVNKELTLGLAFGIVTLAIIYAGVKKGPEKHKNDMFENCC